MSVLADLAAGFAGALTPWNLMMCFAGVFAGQIVGALPGISVPGEPSSVMTAIDGHQMALQGRAGTALGIAAIGSFIAGTLSTLGLMLLAPPLARAWFQVPST